MRQQRKKCDTVRRENKKKERKKMFHGLNERLNIVQLVSSTCLVNRFSRYFSLSFLFPSFPLLRLSLSLCVLSSPGYFAAGSNHSLPFTHRSLTFPISLVHSPPFSFPSTFFFSFHFYFSERGGGEFQFLTLFLYHSYFAFTFASRSSLNYLLKKKKEKRKKRKILLLRLYAFLSLAPLSHALSHSADCKETNGQNITYRKKIIIPQKRACSLLNKDPLVRSCVFT